MYDLGGDLHQQDLAGNLDAFVAAGGRRQPVQQVGRQRLFRDARRQRLAGPQVLRDAGRQALAALAVADLPATAVVTRDVVLFPVPGLDDRYFLVAEDDADADFPGVCAARKQQEQREHGSRQQILHDGHPGSRRRQGIRSRGHTP